MKSAWAWTGLASAGAVAGLMFACTNSGGGGFPYSGPSCTSKEITSACWSCVQSSCGSVSSCVTGACSSYSQCYCACASGDPTCQANCLSSAPAACQQCVSSPGLTCAGCSSECAGSPFASGSSSGGGSCMANTATVTCNGTDLPCSAMRCCPANTPYHCDATGMCYPTEAEARASCGSACVTCGASGSSSGGASCTPSSATSAGCASGSLGCTSTKCCPSTTPYYCDSDTTCYATAAAASTACGSSCTTCSP